MCKMNLYESSLSFSSYFSLLCLTHASNAKGIFEVDWLLCSKTHFSCTDVYLRSSSLIVLL